MSISFKTNKTKYILLLALLLLGFSSCDLLTGSFEKPVKDYFKEYTETSGVMRWEITKGVWTEDANGRISISSSQDAEISLYLRNPQNFSFSSENARLDFSRLDNSEIEKAFGIVANESLVTILQDESDFSVLRLEYPKEFILQTETGFEIAPAITLLHPVSQISFPTYSDLNIYSNSPPPQVYGAVVYQDSEKYVLLFNMPEKSLLSGIHQDVAYVSVQSNSSSEIETSVSVNKDGTFSFGNSSFRVGDVSSSYTMASVPFVENGQAAYFVTNDALSDQNTTYTITLKDKAGLSSSVQAYVYSIKLGDVNVLDSSKKEISSGYYLEQDEGSSYATVTFRPSQTATDFATGDVLDTADSIVVYEIYQGENDSGKLIESGKNSGGELTMQIPSGTVFVRVYAHKDLYVDSSIKELLVHVLRSTIYVSPNGSDDANNGSQDSPFGTITKAIKEFSHLEKRGTVYLEGDILDSPELSVPNANLFITGNGHSIEGFTMSADGGKLTANKISFTRGFSLTNGNATVSDGTIGSVSIEGGTLELKNVTVEGDITISGGNLTLNNTTVNGNITYTGGKLILEGSTTVANGKKITMSKDLTIGVKNLSEDKVAEIAASPAFDEWSQGVEVLESLEGDDISMSETVHKFTLESNRWVLVQGSDKTNKGVLGRSEAGVDISEYIVEFTVSPESFAYGTEITVTPVVKRKSNGETISSPKFEDWNISIMQGESNLMNSKENKITIPDAYPSGTYSLKVSVKYNGLYYSGSFEIKIK